MTSTILLRLKFSFYGQPPDYYSHVFSLGYSGDESSFKEMRTWGRSKITFYCICVWCETAEIAGGRSSWFPCVTPVADIFPLDRVAIRIPLNISYRVPLRKQPMTVACWLFPQKGSTTDFRLDCKCRSDWRCCECGVWVDCLSCMGFVTAGWGKKN